LQDLAQAVRDRREQLGLGQIDLAHRGGPSLGTIQNIEQGARERYASRTFAQLDRALVWTPGSARALMLHGHGPQVIASASTVDRDARALVVGRAVLALIDALTAERIT
jgi:hypothetical protein